MVIQEIHISLRELSNRNPGFYCALHIVLWSRMLDFQ